MRSSSQGQHRERPAASRSRPYSAQHEPPPPPKHEKDIRFFNNKVELWADVRGYVIDHRERLERRLMQNHECSCDV